MPRSAKPADFDDEFNPLREGATAIGGAIMRNPLVVGGTTAFLVAFSYISSNAVWYQPHFHTGAFFATRDVVDLSRLPSEGVSETTIIIQRGSATVPSPSDPVVQRVQSILRDLDFYAGDVDGLMGPNTRRAIEVYRDKVGLPASGDIDDELLDHLGARGTTSAVAMPSLREETAIDPADEFEPIPTAKPAVVTEGDPQVRKIQAGLRAFGHDTMEIDGLLGSKTRAAIREFQSLFGLPVTGEPDAAVHAKMREVGLTD
ncbi:MAG: peptidoglycan-binding protein [Rhizobiaceae bacterium]|nr:peptidoglycan-binding protein [Rhizobiaceae bacterium]